LGYPVDKFHKNKLAMSIFSKDGRLIIPIHQRSKKVNPSSEEKVRYIIEEAYCPNGCNIVDHEIKINDFPGLRNRFKRPGNEGEFVVSAIEGDFTKKMISGSLEEGVKDELYCPYCGLAFLKLVNCNCKPGADMVVVGLTPQLDFNNAVTFCNVTGCSNGSFIKSGDALLHVRLQGRI
jgi:hypothetical protein